MILNSDRCGRYVDAFNALDRESIRNHIPNAGAFDWMRENIPLFECPDADMEQIYYFRWWVYRKHIKKTPDGYVVTEFLPQVGHSGKYNTINHAAGLHIREGRWLRDAQYMKDYALFWFRKGGERRYSAWFACAIEQLCLATGDFTLAADLLPDLVAHFREWTQSHQHESGLYWSRDGRDDGGEYSISGNGLRPTLNSYMYGEAAAIARIARRAGRDDWADEFAATAARMKALVQQRLWDPKAQFFKAIPLADRSQSVANWDFAAMDELFNVREIYGYLPWMFAMPDPGYEAAWRQLTDPAGFCAPFGPTTAEQRHPRFMKHRVKRCQWDGPSWPFTTSTTLIALANLLTRYSQEVVTPQDYFQLLRSYAISQHRALPYGEVAPWIDENLHPQSGVWLARAIILEGRDTVVKDLNHGIDRGKDYNHSSFADLVISGLVGLQPRADDVVELIPLLPPDTWDWFCLDKVPYHGRTLTVCYDKYGTRYDRGKGLALYADGAEVARAQRVRADNKTVRWRAHPECGRVTAALRQRGIS